jgi:hypothetical protein
MVQSGQVLAFPDALCDRDATAIHFFARKPWVVL